MYERFYHLRDRPFALSPDPDYLYPSRVHREALDYLRFGIEGNAGFVVVTGEIGSGKTTLLQVLLRNLDGQTTVIRLVNTLLTGRELIESLLLDMGVQNPPATKPLMLRELARILVEQRAGGRRVVAVIDEAQNLSADALEEVRMLSNLETEKSKLMQIVLVGQPDLRDNLERPGLEQLRQRVTVRYHIDPLDSEETTRYINHRLKRAAIGAPLTFPEASTELIHARSGGVPRLINVICDAVLLCGYAEESRTISEELVRTAIEELESSSVLRRSSSVQARPADDWSRMEQLPQRPALATPATLAASATPAAPVAAVAAPRPGAWVDDLPLRAAPAQPRANEETPQRPQAEAPARREEPEDVRELLSDRVMAEQRAAVDRPAAPPARIPSPAAPPAAGPVHAAAPARAAAPVAPAAPAERLSPRPSTSPAAVDVVEPPRTIAPANSAPAGRTVAHVRPTPQPVSFQARKPASNGTWARMKEALFGAAPGVERR